MGLPRQSVKRLDWGGKPAALVTYGENLGGIAVIEQTADANTGTATGKSGSAQSGSAQSGSSQGAGGQSPLSLPTVKIKGANAQELNTALGTVLRFSRGGVAYTVLGSVPAYAAEQAADGL